MFRDEAVKSAENDKFAEIEMSVLEEILSYNKGFPYQNLLLLTSDYIRLTSRSFFSISNSILFLLRFMRSVTLLVRAVTIQFWYTFDISPEK